MPEPEPSVVVPLAADPVVAGPVRFVALPGVVVAAGGLELVLPVGLFAESDPAVPRLALPLTPVPHGNPFAPIRPAPLELVVLPWALVLGLEGLLEFVELAAVFGFEVVGLVALGFIVL